MPLLWIKFTLTKKNRTHTLKIDAPGTLYSFYQHKMTDSYIKIDQNSHENIQPGDTLIVESLGVHQNLFGRIGSREAFKCLVVKKTKSTLVIQKPLSCAHVSVKLVHMVCHGVFGLPDKHFYSYKNQAQGITAYSYAVGELRKNAEEMATKILDKVFAKSMIIIHGTTLIFKDGTSKKMEETDCSTEEDGQEFYTEHKDIGVFYYPATRRVWAQGQTPTYNSEDLTEQFEWVDTNSSLNK